MQAEEFLEVAKHLHQQNGEAFWRSAASRAYYFGYHTCAQAAEIENLPPAENRKTGSHQQLISRLLHSPDKRLNKLGKTLKQFRQLRTEADYRLNANFSKDKAHKSLQFANFFIPKPE